MRNLFRRCAASGRLMVAANTRAKNRITMGVQGAIFDDQKRVLLVRHGYQSGWHFPGGGLERREVAEVGLRRELIEEVGVVLLAAPRLFGIYTHFDRFPGDHIVLYVIDNWHQPTVPAPSFEIREQRFVALDELPDDILPGTRRRIEEIIRGDVPAAAW